VLRWIRGVRQCGKWSSKFSKSCQSFQPRIARRCRIPCPLAQFYFSAYATGLEYRTRTVTINVHRRAWPSLATFEYSILKISRRVLFSTRLIGEWVWSHVFTLAVSNPACLFFTRYRLWKYIRSEKKRVPVSIFMTTRLWRPCSTTRSVKVYRG